MNKKGEMGIALIIMVFITIIVGVILFTAISQEVGRSNTLIEINQSNAGTVTAWTNNTAFYFKKLGFY